MNSKYIDIEASEMASFSELIYDIHQMHIKRYYTDKGNEEFKKFISPEETMLRVEKGHKFMKMTEDNELIGAFEFKKGKLYSLFILDDKRGKGYARMIINWIKKYFIEQGWEKEISVNVSPNAYAAYEKLGFVSISSEAEKNGMISKEMVLKF